MRDSHRSIVRVIAQRPARAITCAVLAVALTAAPVICPVAAYAVSAETKAELANADQKVSSSTSAYNTAVSKLSDLQKQIDENEAAIKKLEKEIPQKQQAASDAMREMYKYQQGSNPVVDVMVNAGSLNDFVATCAYMGQIQDSNNEAIEDLNSMQADLEQKQAELDSQKKQLEQEKQTAANALAAAQKERQKAQEQAEAEAAAELAAAAKDTKPAKAESSSNSGSASSSSKSTSSSSKGENSENKYNTANKTEQTADVEVSHDVDWGSSDRAQFVKQWGSRINAYLSGSPLAGYGETFAAAAWDYGVDPRWSPAIATVESTKGTYCFRPYNAWGWMGKSFSSWDEAIPAHVRYLKNMYGTTLTPSAAKRYCPPTWQDWYNKVGAEMNKI